MNNINEIVGRLSNVRRTGSGWIASCPCAGAHKHGDRKQSLSVNEGQNGRPLLHCFGGCSYFDIAAALGIESRSARRQQKTQPRPSRTEPDLAQAARRMAAAAEIWREARPIAGSPAERYLRWRSIAVIPDDVLKFHPSCPHPSRVRLPAMVAAVGYWRNGSVEACGVHRTYLRPDGAAKAAVEPAKASLGPIAGAAVWLSDSAPILAVGEGIETVLSVATALPEASAYAAALSAPNLALFELPAWIADLVILADRDKAGEDAALALAAKAWRERGLRARIARPPERFNDFNDALCASNDESGSARPSTPTIAPEAKMARALPAACGVKKEKNLTCEQNVQ
jgi:hypothetical protein